MKANKTRKKFRDFIPGWNLAEYSVLRMVSWFVNLFPIARATWLARRLGDFLFLILRKRRGITADNVEKAFGKRKSRGEKRRIVKESFRSLATSLMEFFRVADMLKHSEKYFSITGAQYLDEALAKGKGVVLVVSHLGSWEYLAFLAYIRHYHFSVVGKPMSNPYVSVWIKSLRKKVTLNHIDKDGAAKPILKELKKNHVVAILIDQWAGKEGLWGNFFGRPTSTTSIPARLARKTGCALVPAYCVRTLAGRYAIEVKPEVVVPDGDDWEAVTTRELNRLLEQDICRFPGQWTWTHRRWKPAEAGHRGGEDKKTEL